MKYDVTCSSEIKPSNAIGIVGGNAEYGGVATYVVINVAVHAVHVY